MIQPIGSSGVGAIPPMSGPDSNVPVKIIEDLYSLIPTLYMCQKNLDNNPFMLQLIAQQVATLRADLTAWNPPAGGPGAALLAGINAQLSSLPLGASIGSICSDLASGGGNYAADISDLEDNIPYLQEFAQSITGTKGPFFTNMNTNWFAMEGLSGQYDKYKTTNAGLPTLMTAVAKLQYDMAHYTAGDSLSADVIAVNNAIYAIGQGSWDPYINSLNLMLHTVIPGEGKSLIDLATAGNETELGYVLQRSSVLGSTFNNFFTQFGILEGGTDISALDIDNAT